MLGIVQGLTEFLPVSSSGHLVLGGVVLGLTEPHLLFDVVLHVGTLAATLVFYRDTLAQMGRELLRVPEFLRTRGSHDAGADAGWSMVWRRFPALKLATLIAIGCVPTAAVGLVFKDQLEALFAVPRAAAAMLLVTAALLIGTRLTRLTGTRLMPSTQARGRGIDEMGVRAALLIGLVQGIAIIPGISRSGSTIAAALFLGIDRELAARFSFLLSIPAIAGALLLQVAGGGASTWNGGTLPLVTGFAAAAVVGLAALAVLIPLVRHGRFHVFAYYLTPLAVAALIWLP